MCRVFLFLVLTQSASFPSWGSRVRIPSPALAGARFREGRGASVPVSLRPPAILVGRFYRQRYNGGMKTVLEKTSERMLTVAEVAAELGLTEGRVRQLLLSGEMRGQKFGRTVWMIPESEVSKFRDPPSVGRPRSRVIRK